MRYPRHGYLPGSRTTMRLALFDLDHTLLSADSDVLWCEFLVAEGRLDVEFVGLYRAIAQRYDAGTVTPVEYCNFHAGTLAGLSPAGLLPLRPAMLPLRSAMLRPCPAMLRTSARTRLRPKR